MASEGALSPRKATPKVQCSSRPRHPLEMKAPKDTCPGALRGYKDIRDKLVRLTLSATGASGGEWDEDRKESQQEEDPTCLDPGLLSYIDKVCSQEDFVIQVEGALHPRFLAQLLFPEAPLDFLALTEDVEQEEGLTPVQLLEKRLLDLKEEEGVQTPLSHSASQLVSSPSESVVGLDDRDPHLGVNDKASPPETDFQDCQRHGQADAHLASPKAFAVSSGHQECPALQARCPLFVPEGHRRIYSGWGPRDTSIPIMTSPVRETLRPAGMSSECDLHSLPFLWASHNSLLPSALSLGPVPALGLACPGGQGPQGALQSQPQKRKCHQSVPGSWRRKRHCSQYRAAGCPSHCQTLGTQPRCDLPAPRGSKGSLSSQG